MNLINYIRDVQTRPEEAKQKAVWLWTLVLFGFIVLVWFVSLGISFSNNRAEDLALQLEARRLAEEKSRQQNMLAGEERAEFIGLIPWLKVFASEAGGNIANGFWLLGDKLHK